MNIVETKTFKKVVLIVLDGCGIGDAPDAHLFDDYGSNTIKNTATFVKGLRLPHLEQLGLGCLNGIQGLTNLLEPKALVAKLTERSPAKDTTSGHWELMGFITKKPFSLFPNGFPNELIEKFIQESAINGVLGNKSSSGTEIIKELGEEHIKTLKPIVYTSSDSVFQIAAHEKYFGLDRLYKISEIARRITEKYYIGRVISRPFIGEDKLSFSRTENRRDYSLPPSRKTALDVIYENSIPVISLGKIEDIFCHRSISYSNHTGNNHDTLLALEKSLDKYNKAFIFANLSDFDTLYGHRRNPFGFAKCLEEFDSFIPKIINKLKYEDMLIITADHGCDPTFKGTDHTREKVPVLVFSPCLKGRLITEERFFSDVGKTITECFRINSSEICGKSLL